MPRIHTALSTHHVSEPQFQQMLRNGVAPHLRCQVVEHLAAGCEACLELLTRAGRHGAFPALAADAADDAVTLALRRLALWCSGSLHQRMALLAGLLPAHRLALWQTPRGNLGFCWLVIEESRARAVENPAEILALAQAALAIVSHEGLRHLDPSRFHNVQACAHARVGNAYRLLGDHLSAEDALATARLQLHPEVKEPEPRATLLELEAFLLLDQGLARKAVSVFEEVEELLTSSPRRDREKNPRDRKPNLRARQAEIRIHRGTALLELEEAESAAEVLGDVCARLSLGTHPRLYLSAAFNLAIAEARAGDPKAACNRLAALEGAYRQSGDALLSARRSWLLGSLLKKLSEGRPAVAHLETAAHSMMQLGRGDDAVVILVELAALYGHLGRRHDLTRLTALFLQLVAKPEAQRQMSVIYQQLWRELNELGIELEPLMSILRDARPPELPS